MNKIQERIAQAIREAYPLPSEFPNRLRRLRALATWDLWHGTVLRSELDADDAALWPGFSAACRELSDWADDNLPQQLFYVDDCGLLLTDEPEPWQDDETGEWLDPEPYYVVERREILAAVFPSKLSEYL